MGQELEKSQISIEFNPLEGKSLWQDSSLSNVIYHSNQSGELQIILQEAIDMIDSLTEEKIIEDDERQKEMIENNERQEKTIRDNNQQ